MQYQVTDSSDREIKILLLNATCDEVATLRKVITQKLPTVAISTVTIFKNTSSLNDEVIAMQLGQMVVECLPLKFSGASFKLDVTAERFKIMVTGHYLILAEYRGETPPIIAYPDTPLFPLFPGQEISLRAECDIGNSDIHPKWSPAIVYFHQADLSTEKRVSGDERTDFVMTIESTGCYPAPTILEYAQCVLDPANGI